MQIFTSDPTKAGVHVGKIRGYLEQDPSVFKDAVSELIIEDCSSLELH